MSLIRTATVVLCLTLCGCAVVQAPARMASFDAIAARKPQALAATAEIVLDTNYSRTLRAGSQWSQIGSIEQGQVYKPVNDVLTVEGSHVHEAYLVLQGGQLVGFYLPAEQTFSPLSRKVAITLN